MTFLKVLQPEPERAQPLFERTADAVRFAEGFWDEERDGNDRFHWMGARGVLRFTPDSNPRYLELWVLSEFHDLTQAVTITADDGREDCRLAHGWSPLSVVVPPGADMAALTANKPFPSGYHPADARVLSIRVRDLRLHHDAERHAAIRRQQENLVLNAEELLAGHVELASTPSTLGIDMHGACNVKPPCVYCEWDFSKDLEGENVDVPFTRDTLKDWGPFFDNSTNLVNCSIGEPFMMKNFDELLDIFGTTGKVLEMTTNGQILTDRNVQKLVGRPVELYVSLDAATPLTYARLRNDTFEKILANLRRLIGAKGGRGGWPRVHLVFMPMRCNVDELDDFVRLCADLDVDRLVLRPLNYSDSIALDSARAGYHFVYKNELLPFEELVRASGRAAQLCRDLHVELSDQMDFGGGMRTLFEQDFASGEQSALHSPLADVAPAGAALEPGLPASQPPPEALPGSPARADTADPPLPSLGAERQPACLEPWKSLYILRRGVLPCCYGGEPIAPLDGHQEAWNSPLMRSIRQELLEGRFHDYCLRSQACPIVRKSEEAHALPFRQRALQRVRHRWGRLNRDLNGVPNRVWLPIRWVVTRVWRGLTDPSYVARHARRMRGISRAP